MNSRVLVLALVATFAFMATFATAGMLIRSPGDKFAPGHEGTYIVIFEDHATEAQKASLLKVSASVRGARQAPRRIEFGRFSAFAGHLEEAKLEEIASLPFVKMVTLNKEVRAYEPRQSAFLKAGDETCERQQHATWGIDRITEREIVLDGVYIYDRNWGNGVTAYVVDTGIYIQHEEFEGRAQWGGNFVDTQDKDCNGHGTHVAGTMGGKTYGIARNATLVAVKVLNCAGSGSYQSVMSGIQFVAKDAAKRGTRAVLNMSLGGPKDSALDAVVRAAVADGVVVVVAAGNENTDACYGSPSNVADAITVAASEIYSDPTDNNHEKDGRASFSNYGTCVDLYAPGARITSAWIDGPTALKTISGTSMASPHVAGVATVLLARNTTATPEHIKQLIVETSTPDVINMKCSAAACNKTPNKLLFVDCNGEPKRRLHTM